MAEYLIQDTTLDAIADAINAKTGGSSAMTPAEMVTAIGSIQTGGVDHLKTATVTLTQDYPASITVGTTIKNLIDTAIGTDYWIAWVSAAPSNISEFASIVIGGVKVSSLNVANMSGYDTATVSSSATIPTNAAFWRSYSTQYAQGPYPGQTNARAYAGMTYQIWGWDA